MNYEIYLYKNYSNISAVSEYNMIINEIVITLNILNKKYYEKD